MNYDFDIDAELKICALQRRLRGVTREERLKIYGEIDFLVDLRSEFSYHCFDSSSYGGLLARIRQLEEDLEDLWRRYRSGLLNSQDAWEAAGSVETQLLDLRNLQKTRFPVQGPKLPAIPRDIVWDLLEAHQSGICATCEGSPKVIDHDHNTDLVRGLLCSRCNSVEAKLKGILDPVFVPYRNNPPAEQIGMKIYYRTLDSRKARL